MLTGPRGSWPAPRVTRHDVVGDLGAGFGALTAPLAATGARVIAVELHPRRAAALRSEYAGTRVAVVELDLRDFTFPGRPYRVVANPPYAGVNALIRRRLPIATPDPRTWSSARAPLADCSASHRGSISASDFRDMRCQPATGCSPRASGTAVSEGRFVPAGGG